MTTHATIAISGLLVVGLGCSSAPPATPRGAPAPHAQSSSHSTASVRTTAGRIFERNLNGHIAGLESRVALEPYRTHQLALATALHKRGCYAGSIDDIARAVTLASAALEAYPQDQHALIVRARAALSLHRFSDARRDLDSASRNGAARAITMPLQAEIEWSQGSYESASATIRQLAEVAPSTRTLTRLALLEEALGNRTTADVHFAEAERHLEGVDPLPVAWFYVQWGHTLMSRGELSGAEAHLSEAVRRLPGYVMAKEHLAESIALQGRTREAIALYEEVTQRSADPEFVGVLAGLYRELGEFEKADELRKLATARFDAYLERHPAAMYWHASNYFRQEGDDPRKALDLLTQNAVLRPNAESLVALAGAQLENDHTAAAKRTIDRALAMAPRSTALFETAAQAYRQTGDASVAVAFDLQARKLGQGPKFL